MAPHAFDPVPESTTSQQLEFGAEHHSVHRMTGCFILILDGDRHERRLAANTHAGAGVRAFMCMQKCVQPDERRVGDPNTTIISRGISIVSIMCGWDELSMKHQQQRVDDGRFTHRYARAAFLAIASFFFCLMPCLVTSFFYKIDTVTL